MNREMKKEAEKDLMKQDKPGLLMLNYQLLNMLQNDEINGEQYIEHRDLIKKVWKKKYGTDIMLEEMITSED